MKLISWNIRGLSDLGKCRKVKSVFMDNNIDTVLIQETKIESPDYCIFKSLESHFLITGHIFLLELV